MKDNHSLEKPHFCRQAGYSLIELSISLLLLGLMVAAVAGMYNNWQTQKSHDRNIANMDSVAGAVAAFQMTHGRYPCPAAINLPRTDPNYGYEANCKRNAPAAETAGTFLAPSLLVSGAPRPPVSGIDLNGDDVVDGADTEQLQVRIGALPFRSLNLDEVYSIDSYRQKILYAVTEAQARQGVMYSPEAAAIRMIDETGATLGNGAREYFDFAVISNGMDRAGGYTRDGIIGRPCNAAARDGENCDNDSVFRVAPYSTAQGANYHDDLVVYNFPTAMSYWARETDDTRNIVNIRTEDMITTSWVYDYVKFVKDNYAPTLPWMAYFNDLWTKLSNDIFFHTAGNVRVEGDIQAQRFCDQKSADCFETELIAGEDGLLCATNALMVGIANATATCNNNKLVITCNTGYMQGIDNEGNPVCKFLPCRAQQGGLACGETVSLPDADHGTSMGPYASGSGAKCVSTTFSCNNGSWTSSSGSTQFCSNHSDSYSVGCSGCDIGGITYTRYYSTASCSYGPYTQSGSCTPNACPPPPPPPDSGTSGGTSGSSTSGSSTSGSGTSSSSTGSSSSSGSSTSGSSSSGSSSSGSSSSGSSSSGSSSSGSSSSGSSSSGSSTSGSSTSSSSSSSSSSGSSTSGSSSGGSSGPPSSSGPGGTSGGGSGIPGSDIRLKDNIVFEGTYGDIPLYSFSYKTEPGVRYLGTMAQDIIGTHPDAVIVGPDGYYRVDYRKLGLEMKRLTP